MTGADTSRRCLTREQAADYCGLTPTGFYAWQRQGIIPGPIPGTKRWDRHALDAALDKASGLRHPEAGGINEEVEEWFRRYAEHPD